MKLRLTEEIMKWLDDFAVSHEQKLAFAEVPSSYNFSSCDTCSGNCQGSGEAPGGCWGNCTARCENSSEGQTGGCWGNCTAECKNSWN